MTFDGLSNAAFQFVKTQVRGGTADSQQSADVVSFPWPSSAHSVTETCPMSDHASHDIAPASDDAPLFTPVEVEQFAADDVMAGGAIGKMLSALFLYTVVAMGITSWWTYSSIIADRAEAAELNSGGHSHEHEPHGEHEHPVEHAEK